uniref:Acetyltransferase GNAT domain protein n=1 Tax=Pithovirus LCPAC403 TaxID=2506596 RepID=A0A481ZDD7_9VIRU|nr:MAG: acetyltransferase GNAT domain protein [Pithovirus LCPAC403]
MSTKPLMSAEKREMIPDPDSNLKMAAMIKGKLDTALAKRFRPRTVPQAFLDILPPHAQLFVIVTAAQIDIRLCVDANAHLPIRANSWQTVGYISAVGTDDRTAIVGPLYTEKPFRENGVATYLLIILAAYAKIRGIHLLTLYDGSDRSWKPHNMYINTAFKYVKPYPDREMKASVEQVIATWPGFAKKYQKSWLWRIVSPT